MTRVLEAHVDSILLSVFIDEAVPASAESNGPVVAVWVREDLEHVKVWWNRDISDTIDSITVEELGSDSPDDTPPFSDAIPFSFDGREPARTREDEGTGAAAGR